MIAKEFTGEFGGTEEEAVQEAREFYALENGTDPDQIEIVKVG